VVDCDFMLLFNKIFRFIFIFILGFVVLYSFFLLSGAIICGYNLVYTGLCH
jgi:hypothetical protein